MLRLTAALACFMMAFIPIVASADTLVDNVDGIAIDRAGKVTRFTGLWIDDEGRGPAFALHVEPAPAAVSDPDPATSAAALNAAVERIARRDPAQYQWTYKRFSVRPPGSGEENPYWPGCY